MFVCAHVLCVCVRVFVLRDVNVLHTVSDAQGFKDGKTHYRFTADDGHDGGDKKSLARPEFSRFQLLVSFTFTVGAMGTNRRRVPRVGAIRGRRYQLPRVG